LEGILVPTDPKRVQAVFLAAAEQDARDRVTLLDRECGSDAELRQRVEALLQAHDDPGSFLDQATGELAPTIDQPITEKPGTFIGRYKLLEQIGEGGFGVVFMAEQEEPVRRKVALKIIKPGMDTREVIARFEAERQALAIMDDPNIAKILDAGATESGRPYFVMELVRGSPITSFCNQNSLTTRERLELFTAVCQAVQHAHQKGIIHRDIKPSNVMVTLRDDRPIPKVIDFGVAKATNQRLTEKTLFTRFAQTIGTPLYMSPEQAGASELDIDTRSDIYSLGVLLYELLTGTTPFDRQRMRQAAYDELLRIIREEEPPRPSLRISTLGDTLPSVAAQRSVEPKKLSSLFRGELDWIVMKALEKDRTRRYETANGLAADVRRYLDDEPVVACPPSAAYRFKKFARRNKAAFAIATVVGCALLVAVGAVTGSIGWAMRSRSAMQEQIIRDQAARHLVVEHAVEKSLEVSAEYVQAKNWQQALAEARRAEAALTGEEPQGELQRNVDERLKDLMMVTRVEQIRLERVTFREGAFDYAGADRKYAQAFREYGIDLENLDVETAAERIHGRAVAEELAVALDNWADLRRTNLELDETSWRHLVAVARAADDDPLRNRLRVLWGQVVTEEIDKEFAQLATSQRLESLSPTTLCLLARTLYRTGHGQEAIRVLRRAQQTHPSDFWVNKMLAHRLHEEAPEEGESVRFYTAVVALRPQDSAIHNSLGNALRKKGDLEGAIWEYKRAMELNPEYAHPHCNIGVVLQDMGDLEGAIREYQKSIELDPECASSHNNLGNILKGKGDLEGATREFKTAIELDPELAQPHSSLGVVLSHKGDLEGAIWEFKKAIELDPENVISHVNLGGVLQRKGDLEGSIRASRKAIELDPKNAKAHNNLGIALGDEGDLEGAIREFKIAIELDPELFQPHNSLGNLLSQKGDLEGAIPEFRKAIELGLEDAAPHHNLGRVLRQTGDLEGAIREYRKAIELAPKFAAPHNMLGNILKQEGDLEGAIREFNTAIELDPKNANSHTNLGIALWAKEDLKGAIREFKIAIELNPENANSHNNLAIVWKTEGNLEGSIREYKRAIELDPELVQPHHYLGHALEDKGDLEGAIRALNKAIELEPEGAMLHVCLGRVLQQTGDRESAMLEFNTAVDLFPGPASRTDADWGDHGQALYCAGRFEEARESLEKIIQLQDDDGPTIEGGDRWWFYIMTLWQVGETDRAEAYFRQLDEAVKDDLPEEQESSRDEAAELLKIDQEPTKEPDDVN
jgi:Flp pilus assembly protein TadD